MCLKSIVPDAGVSYGAGADLVPAQPERRAAARLHAVALRRAASASSRCSTTRRPIRRRRRAAATGRRRRRGRRPRPRPARRASSATGLPRARRGAGAAIEEQPSGPSGRGMTAPGSRHAERDACCGRALESAASRKPARRHRARVEDVAAGWAAPRAAGSRQRRVPAAVTQTLASLAARAGADLAQPARAARRASGSRRPDALDRRSRRGARRAAPSLPPPLPPRAVPRNPFAPTRRRCASRRRREPRLQGQPVVAGAGSCVATAGTSVRRRRARPVPRARRSRARRPRRCGPARA